MKDPYKAPGGYIIAQMDTYANQYNWISIATWEEVLALFENEDNKDGARILASEEWRPTPFYDGGAVLQPFYMTYERLWSIEEIEEYTCRLFDEIEEPSCFRTKAQKRAQAIAMEIRWQKALQDDDRSKWGYAGYIYACTDE